MSAVCTVRGPVATDQLGVAAQTDLNIVVATGVAAAHRQTGAPISTHTHAGTRRGLEQQRIFEEEGVDMLLPFEDRGVAEEQIDTMLIHNPRRIFDAEGEY